MGGIRKSRKKYDKPRKRWSKVRIEEEKEITKTYGLKNKRELRVIETLVRKKRQNAKNLLAMPLELRLQREKELIGSLAKYGVLKQDSTLDDVLSLQVREILEKRLATIAWRKNLAKTTKQARQFVVHGHIAIRGEKITSPNYLVPLDEVEEISYFGGKKLIIEPPKPEKKEALKKDFEEAAVEIETLTGAEQQSQGGTAEEKTKQQENNTSAEEQKEMPGESKVEVKTNAE